MRFISFSDAGSSAAFPLGGGSTYSAVWLTCDAGFKPFCKFCMMCGPINSLLFVSLSGAGRNCGFAGSARRFAFAIVGSLRV